jgi:hypothetical protein
LLICCLSRVDRWRAALDFPRPLGCMNHGFDLLAQTEGFSIGLANLLRR